MHTETTSYDGRRSRLLSIISGVVLVLALMFVFGVKVMAGSGPSIDVGAPVTMDQCTPCHVRIAESQTPGLTFKHGAHIVVACSTCHLRMPHSAEGTERPLMVSCLGCHGQYHVNVNGEVARAGCTVCHTETFTLRPADHVESWEERPHAESALDRGTNACTMCHDDAAVQCDSCHEEKAIDTPSVFPAFIPLVPAPEPRPSLTIELEGPVTAGQCLYCHRDVAEYVTDRLIFDHGVHVSREYGCEACHPVFPHTQFGIERNTMADCYRCHSFVHMTQGIVATEECSACHPVEFDLKPVAHTPAFEAGDHGDAVAEDETYCTLCHKGPFCIECHRARRSLADGAPARFVVPEDHVEAVWLSQHGPEFLARAGTCWACHDSQSCERCHQTPMPHPTDWLLGHADYSAPAEKESDCSVCHKDRQWCQECHHDGVRRLDLVAENCVPCHEEMSQKPATEIPHKSFAEHAVHFDVGESKGRPYRCYECHATWASRNGSDHAGSPGEIGHDLRLCYDCHGALDIRSVLIAPYRGSSLCARCHTEGPSARDDSAAPGAPAPGGGF